MLSPRGLAAWCRRPFQDTQFRALLGGASLAFSIKALGVGAAFAFNVILARSYGAGDIGLYFMAISFVEILNTASRLGLEQSAVAVVGRNAPQGNWSKVKGVFRVSTLLILAASSAAAAGLSLLAPTLAGSLFNAPRLSGLLRIICLAIPAMAMLFFLGEALKGLGRLRDSQFVSACCHPLLMLLGLLAVRSAGPISSVAWLYVAAAAATAGLGYFTWRSATPHLRGIAGECSLRGLMDTALPLFWVNMLILGNSRMVTLVIGFFATPSEVGVFSIALRISLLINVAILAIGAFCAPKFAAMHGQKDTAGLAREARRATSLLVVATLPALGLMLLVPGRIMGLFGSEFAGHGAILAILAIGQCFNVATGPVGALLAMTGRQYLLRNIYILTTLPHIILQLTLTPLFHGMGAACAIAFNIVAVNLTAAYMVRKEFGFSMLWPTPSAASRHATRKAPPGGPSRGTP